MNGLMSLYDAKERIRLEDAVIASGIYETLNSAGKHYLALSPKWSDDTHTEIIFWLNPSSQDKYNFGWYTLDDLRAWAENEGKIMKVRPYRIGYTLNDSTGSAIISGSSEDDAINNLLEELEEQGYEGTISIDNIRMK